MKKTTVEDYMRRLSEMRHEMYSNDRTPDGDAINWALGHLEERLKELGYLDKFFLSKEMLAWMDYIPTSLPPAMRAWLCRHLSLEAGKVMFGLNSVQARQEFAEKAIKELEIRP